MSRLSGLPEAVLGELPVTTNLALGSERLRLIFTDRRIVVDHVGKRGAGGVPGTAILGRLGNALEDLFKSGRESMSKRTTEKLSPDQILRAHKDNFSIDYGEVVSVAVVQTPMLGQITIVTGNEKFTLSSRARFDNIVALFGQTLKVKLSVRRLS